MIRITDRTNCCGCKACGDMCGKKAISFVTDGEGFWYPRVDESLCVDCGLCEKVCPMLHKAEHIERYEIPQIYAAYSKDESIRMDSSSGGLYSMLALEMYGLQAFVGGAVFNPDHTVSHILDDDPGRLPQIRGSKYIQSDAEGVYKLAGALLKEGKKVLFCGTPCQIHALYNVVGKDWDNLYTCDIVCLGVNSPKVFLKYMEMLERKFGAKACDIKFRYKKRSWHDYSMRVTFDNGKEYCRESDRDLFFMGYLNAGIMTRPSCYSCPFKGFPQKSDITLGDFWGIGNIDKTMDQDRGTSLVMVNSDKGRRLFDSVKDRLDWKEFTMDQARAGNGTMDKSISERVPRRDDFFRDLDVLPYEKVAAKYFPQPKAPTMVQLAVRALKAIGLHPGEWFHWKR